jgi:amidase
MTLRMLIVGAAMSVLSLSAAHSVQAADKTKRSFKLEEATIADVHSAIQSKQLTSTQLVTLYFKRIKAYNGVCVREPNGILGTVTTIPNAGQLNALSTLNLRPATLKAV